MGFGGNNGLTDFKDILGFDIQAATAPARPCSRPRRSPWRWRSCACGYIVRSRTGKVLVAIRDAESRTRFCGYRVEHYKLFVWTFSAVIAGIGGALYVPQVGIINPGEFAPANSIEAVIWVAFGGRGTLWGAIVGGLGVNAIKSWLTGSLPRDLAVRAGRAVHRRHPVPAQGHRRPADRLCAGCGGRRHRWSRPAQEAEA